MTDQQEFDVVAEIRVIKKELEEFKIQEAHLNGGIEEWMKTTTEFRQALSTKLDDVCKCLTTLPCKERKGWYESMSRQVAFIWVIVGAIVVGVIADWFKR